MVYLPFIVVICQRYKKDSGLGTVVSLMMPDRHLGGDHVARVLRHLVPARDPARSGGPRQAVTRPGGRATRRARGPARAGCACGSSPPRLTSRGRGGPATSPCWRRPSSRSPPRARRRVPPPGFARALDRFAARPARRPRRGVAGGRGRQRRPRRRAARRRRRPRPAGGRARPRAGRARSRSSPGSSSAASSSTRGPTSWAAVAGERTAAVVPVTARRRPGRRRAHRLAARRGAAAPARSLVDRRHRARRRRPRRGVVGRLARRLPARRRRPRQPSTSPSGRRPDGPGSPTITGRPRRAGRRRARARRRRAPAGRAVRAARRRRRRRCRWRSRSTAATPTTRRCWRCCGARSGTGTPPRPLRLGRLQQVEHEAFVTLLAAAGRRADRHRRHRRRDDGRRRDARAAPAPGGRCRRRRGRRRRRCAVGPARPAARAPASPTARSTSTTSSSTTPARLGIRDFRGSSAVATPTQRHTDRGAGPRHERDGGRRAGCGRRGAAPPRRRRRSPRPCRSSSRRCSRRPSAAWRRTPTLDLAALRAEIAGAIGAEVPELQQLRRLSPARHPARAAARRGHRRPALDGRRPRPRRARRPGRRRQLVAARRRLPGRPAAAPDPGRLDRRRGAGADARSDRCTPCSWPSRYINIAIPSAAARVALNIRFFQRHGDGARHRPRRGRPRRLRWASSCRPLLLVGLLVLTPASLDLDLGNAVDGVGPLCSSWPWSPSSPSPSSSRSAGSGASSCAGCAGSPPRRWRRCAGCARRAGWRCCSAGNLATEVLFASVLGHLRRRARLHVGSAPSC